MLPIKAADRIASTTAVPFDKTVIAAKKKEQRLKQHEPEAAKSVLISSSHPPAENQTTITAPYCTHCKKDYPSVDDYWVLHPDLRKPMTKRDVEQSQTERKNALDFFPPMPKMTRITLKKYLYISWQPNLISSEESLGIRYRLYPASYTLERRLRDFKPYTGGPIAGIGGTKIQPSSHGTVKLACNVRDRRVIMLLSDTLYCPTIGVNLISVSQLLLKRGVNITFHPEYAKIYSPGRTFIATQHGRQYLLNMWSAIKQLGSHIYPSYSMQDQGISLWHE